MDLRKTLVKAYVTIFGHYPALWQEIRYDVISKYLNPGKRYLDIGCGTWELILKNRKRFQELYWIDIEDERFGILKDELVKNSVKLQKQDASKKTDFPDGFFSAITISDVLEHDLNYKSILKETYRILAKWGRLYVTVPGPHDNEVEYDFLGHVLPGFSLGGITKDLEAAGFSIVKTRFYGGVLTNWLVAFGLWEYPSLSGIIFPIWWTLYRIEGLLRAVFWNEFLRWKTAYDGIFVIAQK